MKKTNLIFSVLGLFLAAISAHAGVAGHGVERFLPKDATHVRVFSAKLDSYAVGEKIIADGGIDGPVYESIYKTVLSVTVFYDSADLTDNYYSLGSGPDGQHQGWDEAPQDAVTYSFFITDAQIAAIKNKQVDAKKAVSVAINKKLVQHQDMNAQAVCRYDNDSNQPLNGCVEPVTYKTEVLPVLDISLAL